MNLISNLNQKLTSLTRRQLTMEIHFILIIKCRENLNLVYDIHFAIYTHWPWAEPWAQICYRTNIQSHRYKFYYVGCIPCETKFHFLKATNMQNDSARREKTPDKVSDKNKTNQIKFSHNYVNPQLTLHNTPPHNRFKIYICLAHCTIFRDTWK